MSRSLGLLYEDYFLLHGVEEGGVLLAVWKNGSKRAARSVRIRNLNSIIVDDTVAIWFLGMKLIFSQA
jgi:hypothetical protein